MIQSVMSLQEAFARALLVDWPVLADAQGSGDVLAAHRILTDAHATDIRPLCAKVREDLGASPDPIAAFRAGGYVQRVAEGRQGGVPAGWA
jgi:L-rhamnose isomerase/sugar isomerase